jgi:hypothetical protein
MTNTLPVQVLEERAAEQRRQIHNDVADLRSTLKEQLDINKQVREHILPLSGAAAVLGLLLGYGLTSIFVD